jgi:PhnB protein
MCHRLEAKFVTSISPYLIFNGQAEEAFEFYRSVFGGEFSAKTRYREMPDGDKLPGDERDRIMHIALPLESGVLYGSDALDSRGAVTSGNNVYVLMSPESEAETRRLYDALSAGGEIEMALGRCSGATCTLPSGIGTVSGG